ncbi:CcmD family protein [Aquirufa antheringensis]|jgi:CcmD family protein|uniref:CcmD family protein n=1 Tax=Aquirufa antheringensis TaxID=2516559 RepID=UPI001F8CE3EE|nr:CcmD family protein [Aquirufa antheringensis]MCE4217323.1 CcmD family protein [Pseudarcicella sp. GAP-15]MCZ2478565.1 CcmD family protein [Aquirufa antheringensis]MCZ2487557.1 CcmD family protein [Aquirufa antheringensis]MCZ2489618.1 CcmD family protein [Aquirufa antheringensis]
MKAFLLLLLISFTASAQASDIEMADQFRADGKIYVVIAVVSVVLMGLFAYLFRLERKVTDLEKRSK